MNKHLTIHRICKILHIHYYYENKYGIKEYNKIPFKLSGSVQEEIVDPRIVYLGFDGLKDQYTLLGIPISDSPHFDLMRKLESGQDIYDSEYIKREISGCLDGRYEVEPSDHNIHYQKVKKDILDNSYDPVLLYLIDKKLYAFDGKHRLAVCCLLGLNCKCKIMSKKELAHDKHTQRLYQEIKKRKCYSINLNFMNKIFET